MRAADSFDSAVDFLDDRLRSGSTAVSKRAHMKYACAPRDPLL